MATPTPLSMDEAQGSYVWEVAESVEVADFLAAGNGKLLKSKPFSIGHLMWLLEAFPNGDREDNIGSFMIYLTLVQLPPQWQRVTFLLRLFNQETCSSFTGIATYSVSANSGGWSDGTMLLADLKECMQQSSVNKISLGCQITILALRNEKSNSNHDYQYPLRPEYIHMLKAPNPILQLQWLVDTPLLQRFKTANNGKKFESDIFYDCWSLRCAPKGKRQEDADNVKLYLLLCALPPNIVHCKVRYTLRCEEAEREWTNTRCFSYTYPNVGWPDGTLLTSELTDGKLQHLTQLTFQAKLEILKLYDTDELSVDESSSSEFDEDEEEEEEDADEDDGDSEAAATAVVVNHISSESDTIDSDASSSFGPDATGTGDAFLRAANDRSSGQGHDPQQSLNVTMNVSGYFNAQHKTQRHNGHVMNGDGDGDGDADDDADAKNENEDTLGDEDVFRIMAKKKRSVSFAKDSPRKHRRQRSVAKRSEIKRRQSREVVSMSTALPPILSPSATAMTMHHQFHDRNETDQLPLTSSTLLERAASNHVDSPLPMATSMTMVLQASNSQSHPNGPFLPRSTKYQQPIPQPIPYIPSSLSHEHEHGNGNAAEMNAMEHSRSATVIEHEEEEVDMHDHGDLARVATSLQYEQRLTVLEKQNASMSQQLSEITQMLKTLTANVQQNMRDVRSSRDLPNTNMNANGSSSSSSTRDMQSKYGQQPQPQNMSSWNVYNARMNGMMSQSVVNVDELRNVLFSVRNDLSLLKHKFASDQKQNEKENKIKDWLTYKVQLPQYFDLFIENGLDDMDDIKDLTDAELAYIGVTKLGHRKKMLRAMQSVQAEQQRKFQLYVD